MNDLSDKGMMRSWKMNSSLTYWDDTAVCNSVCNSLGGSRDPGILPVDVNKKDVLSLFIGDLCRKMDFKYVQEVFVVNITIEKLCRAVLNMGIKAVKFRASRSVDFSLDQERA